MIALVERGIKDIGGLNYEKEVIYFERNNIREMEKAAIKFLEALKEHKLIWMCHVVEGFHLPEWYKSPVSMKIELKLEKSEIRKIVRYFLYLKHCQPFF